LSTWLHPIMNGWVANYFRKRSRLQTVSLEEVATNDRSLVISSNIEAVAAVNEALSRLSAADRFFLLLHEREEFTLEEIGQIVGLRKSAVGERLERAREQFRAAIRNGGKFPASKRLTE
jgi:RNA polymerase sigma factor (sigma-70 family)